LKITDGTNLLLRAVTGDEPRQSLAAQAALAGAETVARPLTALCERVSVLAKRSKAPATDRAEIARRLVNGHNVVTNLPAVEAGLAFLDAGADFADGVIAHEGRALGGTVFVSFDKKAVAPVQAKGAQSRLLA
jgi:predicted nucleic-acid-binding protein